MGKEIAGSIGRDNLGMPLVEQGESPSGRAGVDGLPQPVEHKDRLVELSIHDMVVDISGVPSSAIRFLSTVHVLHSC
jgi:hypothetical protein